MATEERLLRNEVKAVVATSALGMGYDKSDLEWVVHFQAPGSVIAYYQQVGRAGRGVDHADVVLLRGAEDRRIQDFFIEQAFPRREHVDRVMELLGEDGGLTLGELQASVNLGKVRLEAMLKVLEVEGAVARDGTRWRVADGSGWEYDAERYRAITELRRVEQRAMAAFGVDGRCLMRALQEELDDPSPADCGRCSVCTAPRFAAPPDPVLVRAAALSLRSRPLAFEPKRMAPDRDTGSMKKLPPEVLVEEGRALARTGDGGWDPLIAAGLANGRFGRRAGGRARRPRAWLESGRGLGLRRAVAARGRSGVRSGGAARHHAGAAVRARGGSRRSRSAQRRPRCATRPSRRRTCAGRSASIPRRSRPGRACSSTTSARPAGRWRWSAASYAAAASRLSSRSCCGRVFEPGPPRTTAARRSARKDAVVAR